jgi:pimeloyl-ACP methyl ester carboxylesterase
LDVDWRSHQRWVQVDGQPVNTIELGEGPPLVFIHGLSGSWPNWLEQLPVLADEHRVVAMDLPGFGHSPMPAGEISIAGYARVLDGLLGKLGIDAQRSSYDPRDACPAPARPSARHDCRVAGV